VIDHRQLIVPRIVSHGAPLRILPIGDSITWGRWGSDGNGYRLDLLNLLSGNTVTYIGSQHSGTMGSNDNSEGYIGYIIYQIAGNLSLSGTLAQQPNIVLIMAGTNDIIIDIAVDTAPARLGVLIDGVITACPNATILVAEITPILDSDAQARADTYNAAIPLLVEKRVSAGSQVLAVNMSSYLTSADLADGLHPNDEGYAKMANAWYEGIQKVADKGWIQAPENDMVAAQSSGSGTSATPTSPVETDKPSSASRITNDLFWAAVGLLTVSLVL
jgi:lysophospholipase L1-like esterase